MADDTDKIAEVRAKLYSFIANNPDDPDADRARRILGKLPRVDVSSDSRRAIAGMPQETTNHDLMPGPEGGPQFDPRAGYSDTPELAAKHGHTEDQMFVTGGEHSPHDFKLRTPYGRSQIDPTGQFVAEQVALGGAGRAIGEGAGWLLGKALSGTRGAQLAEIADAGAAAKPMPPTHSATLRRAWGMKPEVPVGEPDLAAENAREALKFKLAPDNLAETPHSTWQAAAWFLRHNLPALTGALSRADVARFGPPIAGAAGEYGGK